MYACMHDSSPASSCCSYQSYKGHTRNISPPRDLPLVTLYTPPLPMTQAV